MITRNQKIVIDTSTLEVELQTDMVSEHLDVERLFHIENYPKVIFPEFHLPEKTLLFHIKISKSSLYYYFYVEYSVEEIGEHIYGIELEIPIYRIISSSNYKIHRTNILVARSTMIDEQKLYTISSGEFCSFLRDSINLLCAQASAGDILHTIHSKIVEFSYNNSRTLHTSVSSQAEDAMPFKKLRTLIEE